MTFEEATAAASTKLGRYLRSDTGLRILSAALAVMLWLFVNSGQHESQLTLQVPVTYRSLPRDLLIVNPSPNFVTVDVLGPPTLLSLLDPGRLALRFDLSGASPGQMTFRLSRSMFRLPRQSHIAKLTPSIITLQIDRIISEQVPVRLVITGPAARGYKVAATELEPAKVIVTGPAHIVSELKQIDTEPVDIAGAASDITKEANLVAPGGRITLSLNKVQARVTLGEIIANREFRGLSVAVRDTAHKFKLTPGHANVTVRGPVLKLSNLDLSKAVYVEAGGATPGWHELPLQVELPDGFQLVRQTPRHVKLFIYHAIQPERG
jgi:YbbR domain-containing protein